MVVTVVQMYVFLVELTMQVLMRGRVGDRC